ncbi:reverse transcriptase-rnase h-integrase, partial [Moniliophthora roreri MCA 2997]
SPLTVEEEQKIDTDISLTEQLAKLGIGIPGNPASTSCTIITRHYRQTAIQQLNDLLGPEETTDTEEQTVEETRNNSTPESIEEDSPTNESSEASEVKTKKLPDNSTSSSFFSAYEEEETMSEGGSSTLRRGLKEEKSQTQMMIKISTAVLEEMEKKKKEKESKVAAPDSFEGDRKDMKRFLMEVEIYLHMHSTDYDTDEKKYKAVEQFPISRSYDHAIELKPEFTPRDCKVYSLTALEQAELDSFLDENLWKGYIRKSKSPMASPFFFVGKKKKGKLRPTQDYWRLNHGTIKNAYPLPLISDLIDKLKDATIFLKLDPRNGYNNVQIKDGDQWKAAFKTNRGLFEPTVMFFGLMNSPATFQAFMDNVLQDFMAEGWCLVYMDDILIYLNSEGEHCDRTRRLLQQLKEQDLYLKPHKCRFDVCKIDFLGLIIRLGQVSMDPVKLLGINEWPTPTTVTGVRSFMGFTNFYQKFIGNYSAIAKPLYDLTKKGVPFKWTAACKAAFTTLKKCFQKEPVL